MFEQVTFDIDTLLISFTNDLIPLTSDEGETYDPYVLTLECTDPFHLTAETVTVEITVVDSDKHPIIEAAQPNVTVLYSLTSAFIIVDETAFSDNTTDLTYAIVGTGFKSGADNTEFAVELDETYTEGVKFLITGFSFVRADAYGENGKEILAYVAATDDANPR